MLASNVKCTKREQKPPHSSEIKTLGPHRTSETVLCLHLNCTMLQNCEVASHFPFVHQHAADMFTSMLQQRHKATSHAFVSNLYSTARLPFCCQLPQFTSQRFTDKTCCVNHPQSIMSFCLQLYNAAAPCLCCLLLKNTFQRILTISRDHWLVSPAERCCGPSCGCASSCAMRQCCVLTKSPTLKNHGRLCSRGNGRVQRLGCKSNGTFEGRSEGKSEGKDAKDGDSACCPCVNPGAGTLVAARQQHGPLPGCKHPKKYFKTNAVRHCCVARNAF